MTWEQVGPDNKIWTEYENKDTGERSIKEHKLRVVKTWCPKDTHDYRLLDGRKHTALCTKCDHETTFILGKDLVEGDKVTIR